MRSPPTSLSTVLVAALLLLSTSGLAIASGGPTPFDSTPDHMTGYWKTTFTDTAGEDHALTVFYPAQADGENTTKDVSGAPYPMMLLVHEPGFYPAFGYYSSYGVHFSQRGYVVGILDLYPYNASDRSDYDEMVDATLDAIDVVVEQHDTPGAKLYGMVNTSAVAAVGHGRGSWVALNAAIQDDADRIQAVASLILLSYPSTGQPSWRYVGQIHQPIMFLEASRYSTNYAREAFDAKAEGFVSLLNIEGANFTQFMDISIIPGDQTLPAEINHTHQLTLTRKYLLAFLDFHLKGDTQAASKLYGNGAAADLADGTLAEWRYGVLDQGVEIVRPSPDAVVPPGPLPICATVSNIGLFPYPARNVTLEVARVLPGVRALQTVYGPENRTTTPMTVGGDDTVQWSPILHQYGDYIAFVRIGDPDHNRTNNRYQLNFTVAPLLAPTIDHDPPSAMELGEGYNLTCRLRAPSGIDEAFVNYSDEDGFRQELDLTEDPATGDHYVHLPVTKSIGQVSYKIHARAGNGAWNVTNSHYIPVVDTTPPTIEHTPEWTVLPVMTEIVINSTVTDNGVIEVVRLLYSEPNTGFHNVSCGRDGDRWFYPMVLGGNDGTLVYSWYAVDAWGNAADSRSFSVSIVDEGPPVIEVVEPEPVELGDDMTMEAKVTDDSILEAIGVIYQRPGEGIATHATPTSIGDIYRLTVVNLTVAGDLTYTWWARDMNGFNSTEGPFEVAVVDTVPPEITDIATGNALVGAEPWVQALVTDSGGLTSVILEYTDVDGLEGSIEMEEILPDLYEARLPPQPSGGALTYKIIASDPSDNTADTGVRTMVVQDIHPPEMDHSTPRDLVEGMEVTFEVEVTDNVGVAEVWLYLRLTSAASFRRLAMENVEGDLYSYTLEEGELRQPHVMYYFEAEDLPPSSNMVAEPYDAPDVTYLLNVTERELRLWGAVKASGGDPIEGATVNLVGQGEVVTNDDGTYEFEDLTAGPYILEVRAKGFEGSSINIQLSSEAGDRKMDVTLIPKRVTGGEEEEETPWMLLAALVIFAIIALLVIFMLRSSARKE